nr:ribonuclease H-like domain-containing protein [Tanacetum cinerariifolium]
MSETSVANDTLVLVPQRQKESDYDNSDPVLQLQNVSSLTDAHVPSQQELDLLFVPLYDEVFTADLEMCMFALTMSTAEPKNIKEAMADSAWIKAMQEELH